MSLTMPQSCRTCLSAEPIRPSRRRSRGHIVDLYFHQGFFFLTKWKVYSRLNSRLLIVTDFSRLVLFEINYDSTYILVIFVNLVEIVVTSICLLRITTDLVRPQWLFLVLCILTRRVVKQLFLARRLNLYRVVLSIIFNLLL